MANKKDEKVMTEGPGAAVAETEVPIIESESHGHTLEPDYKRLPIGPDHILYPVRRALELRVLLDRQRAVEDIARDRAVALQPDANRADRALDAAPDDELLRHDVALHMGAVADQDFGRAQLALDAAVDLHRAVAHDGAGHRHAGAD